MDSEKKQLTILQLYEIDVMRTARTDLSPIDQLTNAAIGAAGEAGELAELIKKHRYQGHELDRAKWLEEAGDTLFYLTLGLVEQGYTLEDCITRNVLKRGIRYPQGFDAACSRDRGR
ncbi:MazG nucleotide pyrophosphohydrolase domain-containing protein [Pelosinus fermentans]|uniref:MazG nucleotide pyrophosphohydrolase n=1 Tax=Pelosinus fermentans B4 TaxID=1149862 RepID=I8RJ22_9FIRM|nr:MazG nucleotide pyrophosphohydrolase domain-containing protein [Pelosinus fermentans]EIW19943.1 MazG nucleotide pyrophosphohydrolase [Pelosinus fermentans B4]EIW21200.1 MazG nucleotide pyrophosphohydrolase [Pelosinus fermentans A11]